MGDAVPKAQEKSDAGNRTSDRAYILYVEDNPDDCMLVRHALTKASDGFELIEVDSKEAFEAQLGSGEIDLVLSDFKIGAFDGLEIIDTVARRSPRVPVVILTGTGSEEVAVKCLRSGAADYVIKKPEHIRRLPFTINAVLHRQRLEEEKASSERAVVETRERLDKVVSNSLDGIVVIDPEWVVRFANPAAKSMLGRADTDLVGRPLDLPNQGDRSLAPVLMPTDDGSRILEVRVTELDWEGQPARLASLRDVTDREEALQRVEHLNKALSAVRKVSQFIIQEKEPDRLLAGICKCLVESDAYAAVWIGQLDEHGKIQRKAALGVESDALSRGELPTCARNAMQGEMVVAIHSDTDCSDCRLTTEIQSGGALTRALRIGDRTYGLLCVHLPAKMCGLEDEQALFAELADDITFALWDQSITVDYQRALRALEETQARLEMSLYASKVGLWDWNLVTGALYLSREWKAQIGFDEDEIAGTYEEWESRLHPDDRQPTLDAMKDYLERKRPEYAVEFRLRHKNGTWAWIYACGQALRDAAGKPFRMMGCHVDISERKRAEQDRLNLEAQLRHSQKLESMGTLASGVAHEINNPINAIMNYAQLIVDRHGADSGTTEFAFEIIKETDRVAAIVGNLLTFARQEKQQQVPTDVAEVIHGPLSIIAATMRKDRIALDIEIPDDLPRISCRSQQIQQVVMNLLTNARDALNDRYTEYDKNKRISVAASVYKQTDQNWVRLTVEDRGTGISDDVSGKIFDPFYTTKRGEKGTGLGLSISHGIVSDHGGRLLFETEVGKYTRFHLELPAVDVNTKR